MNWLSKKCSKLSTVLGDQVWRSKKSQFFWNQKSRNYTSKKITFNNSKILGLNFQGQLSQTSTKKKSNSILTIQFLRILKQFNPRLIPTSLTNADKADQIVLVNVEVVGRIVARSKQKKPKADAGVVHEIKSLLQLARFLKAKYKIYLTLVSLSLLMRGEDVRVQFMSVRLGLIGSGWSLQRTRGLSEGTKSGSR